MAAHPFANNDVNNAMASNRYRHSPQRVRGAGFRYLQQQLLSEELEDAQKDLLRQIMSDHQVELENENDSTKMQPPFKKPKTLKTIDSNMSDETILQFAKQVPSFMSLLASLLKVVDDDGGSVSAKAFLKTCALTVRPGMVPPMMDAKEMVLAALQFLSETTEWIRPVKAFGLGETILRKSGSLEVARHSFTRRGIRGRLL